MPTTQIDPDLGDLEKKAKTRHPDDIEGGLSPGEQASLDQMEAGLGETAEEPSFYKGDGDKDKKADSDKDGGEDGEIPYRDEGQKKQKLRTKILNRKTAIGGGIAGIILAGGFGFMTLVSGPMQVIQFAQFLENTFFSRNSDSSESRIGRMFEYFRTGHDPSKRNVGATMEILSDRYKKGLVRDGITLEFERPGTDGKLSSRLQGLSINQDTEAGKKAVENLKKAGYNVDDVAAIAKVDLRQYANGDFVNTGARRNALNIAVDTQGKGEVSSAIAKRVLQHRAGVDFHPLRNVKRSGTERIIDFRLGRKEERAEVIREGVPNPTNNYSIEGEKDLDENGNRTVSNPTNDGEAAKASAEVSEIKKTKSPVERLKFAGKLLGGGAAAVGALCTVKSIGNDIVDYKHANIILPLIRQAMGIVAAGSQIMAGQDVSLDEIGSVVDDFYDEETGTSIMSAPAVLAAQGKEFGTTNDVTVKPTGVDEKPDLFELVDKIPVLSTACAVQDGIFGAIKRVPIVGSAVTAYENAAAWGINAFLAPFNLSMEGLMNMVVSTLAGDMVNPFAKGAELGGNAMIGSLLAANDAAVASGGTLMSVAAVNEQNSRLAAERSQAFREQGFFERMFDPYDTNSFVAKAFIQNPGFASLSNMASGLASLPANLGSLFGGGLGALTAKSDAISTFSYDYGVGVYGFSDEELENEDYADPYDNAAIVEPQLAELNSRYSKCFETYIDPGTYALRTQATPTIEVLESPECTNDRGTEMFTRYRFYIKDTITARSLACYEGIDETACNELGFGASIGSPGAPGGVTFDPNLPPPTREGPSNAQRLNWTGLEFSDEIGLRSDGSQMKVYIREPTVTTNVKTVVITGSIHGSENAGQFVSYDMLFRAQLPPNIRVIAIPEILPQSSITAGLRKNVNGVDLNRNFPKNWGNVNSDTCNVSQPSCMFYRGPSPASEAETQTLMNYLSGLGRVDLFLVYHDNLNYVAPVGNTDHALAGVYAAAAGMHGQCAENPSTQNCPMKTVWQSGSMDWWYNDTIGSPTILVEMGADQSADTITRHVGAITATLGSY